MTIKQQGGIFGRNPTFNDVEIDGSLTVGGSSVTGTGTIASQDADSVNIDGGAIDGVTLGTNSVVTDARIDNIKIDGNAITTTNTDGDLLITPNGAGSVGIGPHATNPSQAVFCVGKKTEAIQAFFGVNDNALTDPYIQVQGRNTANSSAYSANFGVHADSATAFIGLNGGTDIQFTSAGNVKVSSGSGIDFSATSGTGTSELFDDYEEGTFTPIIEGASSAGTATYTSQVGLYTKVGRTVCISGQIVWSGHTGTGNMRLAGLPFGISSTGAASGAAAAQGIMTITGQAFLYPIASSTYCLIQALNSGSSSNMTVVASGSMNFQFFIVT